MRTHPNVLGRSRKVWHIAKHAAAFQPSSLSFAFSLSSSSSSSWQGFFLSSREKNLGCLVDFFVLRLPWLLVLIETLLSVVAWLKELEGLYPLWEGDSGSEVERIMDWTLTTLRILLLLLLLLLLNSRVTTRTHVRTPTGTVLSKGSVPVRLRMCSDRGLMIKWSSASFEGPEVFEETDLERVEVLTLVGESSSALIDPEKR